MEWFKLNPNAKVQNMSAVGSDHSLILVYSEQRDEKAPQMFRFEAMWAEHKECAATVEKGWQGDYEGSFCYSLVKKLKNSRRVLIDWSKATFPNNRKMIDEIMGKLEKIQDAESPSKDMMQEAESLVRELNDMWAREEQYWFQRSRVKWVEYGDQNSKFFHQTTIQSKQRKKIMRIKSSNDEWVETEEGVMRF